MIETVIDHILEKVKPRMGEDLYGFEMDVKHFLSAHELFSEVEIVLAADPRCAIVARVKASPEAKSLQHVSDSLAEVWEEIYYNHFHAGALHWHRSYTQLRFITVPTSEL